MGRPGESGCEYLCDDLRLFSFQKDRSVNSLGKLFVQLWFYSIVLFLICKFGFGYAYSLRDYVKVFLPTLFTEYWFFTAYIVLACLSPYLNILIQEATQKQLRGFLLCMLFMWVVVPTFARVTLYGSELPVFIMLYTIGAYFQKYPENIFQKKAVKTAVTLGSFLLFFLATFVLDLLGTKISLFQNRGLMFVASNSLLIVGCAVGLFSIFVYQKPFFNPLINTVSACTFGVYLIHDNPVVRKILWKQLLPLANFFYRPYLIVLIFGAVVVVFSVCTLIEFARQKTIAKPMTKLFNMCLEKITQMASVFWNRLKTKADT